MNLNLLKRILSLLLVLTMLVGNLPAAAFAAEDIGEPDFVEETVAPTETEAATEETVEETSPEPTEKVTEPEEEPTDIPEDPDAEKEIPEDDGDPAGEEETEYAGDTQELYADASAHAHPVCGSRCNCASSSHSNLTWTAWDGTTKMYNGNYYLTKDIVLSSTMILDYSYVSYLCLNGHTITCESMVFDIYSYRTLVITDCVGTGKVISTNGNYVIGNNKSLTIYGGTIVNTRESGWNSAILACSNTNTYIYGGRMEGKDMAIYGDVNSKIYVRGGTVAGTGGGYAIYGDGNLTISAGSICTDGSTSISLYSGSFTMSSGSVDGNVYLYDDSDNPGTASISGGTITGGLDCYYDTITITGGDIESAVLSGDTEIRAGTFRGYCTLAGANTNVYGGNFSDCSYLTIYGNTWICGGSFGTVTVGSEDCLYLSGVPEIGELQIASPGTVSAQSPDGSGSFGGDPIPIQMDYSAASVSPWGDGKTLIKNVTSDAVAQKFTLTGFKSEWLYLERSGTNLVLRLLPYGRLNFGEWGIRDGVLTLSGSGSVDSFSSGREQPWYPYANQITAIVIEDGILGIPAYAFEYLENVETIRLPNTLTSLNLNAFQDCGSLNNLVLPASLKTISGTSNTGYPAFIRCESLTDVYYMGTEEEWEILKNGQRITSADSDMTLHCLELVECGATCTQPGPQSHYRFDDQAFGLYDMDKKTITQLGTVPALGHRITQDHVEAVDPLTIESTTSIPFLKEGNTYYSQNHSAYSTCQLKIVAQYACTLTIQYGVSSEPNYDKMFITHNTVDLVNISGVVSNQQRTLDLAAGDKVYILYSKDGTVDKNDDRCWATLIYDHVQLDISEDIPAENFEPDCENAVVCDYCDTVVKAALGHTMSQWTVTTPATCTADGLRNRTCGRCGEGEEEIIPAGHSYDENHQCTVCGAYEQPGGSCGEDLDWTLEQNGQLVISGTGGMSGFDSGEAPWFEDRELITSVVIGEGVTDIGSDAFRDCDNLTTVVLPDGLKTIGDNAFSGCTGLTDINIPDTVTEIGDGAFQNCDSLTCIILPAGITGIGSDAFADCDSLTDIYYGGTAEQWEALGTEVPDHTYIHYSCTDPENHWQPGTQEATCTEDGYTYEGCACGHQRNVVITETKLGHDMGTWTVVLNATCTEPGLQRKDCSRCDHYETEEIPLNGHSHEAVVTPPTCTEDGFTTHTCHCGDTYTDTPVGALGHVPVTDDAVAPTCTETGLTEGSHCSVCGEIIVAQEIVETIKHTFSSGICEKCGIQGGMCGEDLSWTLDSEGTLTISGTGPMYDYFTLGGIEEYPPWYRSDELIKNERINKVVIGNGVTRIGATAFTCCVNLTEIDIPVGVTSIGGNAFGGCDNLIKINIPAGVTSIGGSAFDGCDNLKEVTIPNTVTKIDGFAFSRCISLESVSIPDSLEYLYAGTFEGCTSLKSVILPNGLKNIGNRAFYGCINLTQIELPYSVWSVDEYAFYGCKKLQSIRFPENVVWIGIEAFDGCTSLNEIYFVGDAPDVEENIFKGVTAKVFYPNKNSTWTKSVRQQYGGKLTWIASDPIALHKIVIIPGIAPTCTEEGLTDRIYCSICNEIFSQHEKIQPLGHTKVIDPYLAPTCTKDGLSEGSHCSVCSEVIEAQVVVTSLGHSAVVDDAVSPTCTKIGLLQGTHCKVCSEVLIAQEEIPALGHKFLIETSGFACEVCGEKATLDFTREYILMQIGEEFELRSIVIPTEMSENVEWILEGDVDSIHIREDGTIVAKKQGTAYVRATVLGSEIQSTLRFRVDVTEVPVEGVQLSTAKATTELYSTDYTDLEVLLKLPQNYTLSEQAGVQDDGIAIDSARFTDDILAVLFRISVLDDRRIQIVPTDYAVENPKQIKSKYTGTITVTVRGQEYETGKLTLTVKQTKPKVKATIPSFNSFYTGQSQRIVITGGTPTAICENDAKNTAKTTAIPTWLDLEDGVLTLKETAPRKSVSGKAYLLVDTEEWRIPAAVTLSVKNSYKVPGVKLSASSVTVSNLQKSASVELQLLCTGKTDALSNLNITEITAPEGYTVENFNAETGTFTLKAANGFKSGKLTLGVTYGNVPKNLTLTVKAQDVKLKLSKTKLTLNKLTDDKGTVIVTCTAKDYVLAKPVITLEDSAKGKLDVTYANGELTVATNAATQYGKTYKIFLKAHADAPASTLSVTVATVAKSEVSVTLKTTGKIDVIRDGSAVTVTPTYKNCTTPGAKENLVILNSKNVPVNDLFRIEPNGNGGYTVTKAEDAALTAGTYKIKMESKVGEQEFASKAVKLSVTMAFPKLTVKTSGTTLFGKDKHDRTLVWFEAKDAALNGVARVTIKDTKYQDKFEILDCENGQFAIVFSNGVPETLIGKTVTLNLNVFLEGNPTAKANTTAKVKLTIVK